MVSGDLTIAYNIALNKVTGIYTVFGANDDKALSATAKSGYALGAASTDNVYSDVTVCGTAQATTTLTVGSGTVKLDNVASIVGSKVTFINDAGIAKGLLRNN